MLSFVPAPEKPIGSTETLARELGLDDANLAAFLGISAKTLSRRRVEGRWDPAESARLDLLERTLEQATDLLGPRERAVRWLTSPLLGLEGHAPLELLTHLEGYERVKGALYRQAYGMF